ncbi:trypsin-1-like [Mytilus trossulus]|uniref:trypsin-1-like n=1 Tax=Mytilus trossulus TaxID=6551 RepID=UPI00300644D8
MKVLVLFAAVIGATFSAPSAKNTGCGSPVTQPHKSTYIVGGKESVPHSWPWQVLMRYRTSTLTCGGALIRNSAGNLVVITAAHCVDGTESRPGDWTIDVGVHSRSANEANQRAYTVSRINSHNNYNSRTFDNDIAIMQLSATVTENDDVSPICVTSLPTSDFFNQQCVVTGWGTTSEGGSTSDRLQEVYKPVLSDAACTGYLSNAYNANTMLCAGLDAGGKDACQGDSGGPYACLNAQGNWDLIGIVSWGYGCARPELPGVYADVHKYLAWINNNA